jgi:hypothetical protein
VVSWSKAAEAIYSVLPLSDNTQLIESRIFGQYSSWWTLRGIYVLGKAKGFCCSRTNQGPTKLTFGLRMVGFRWSIEPFVYRILAVIVLRIAIVYEAAEHFLGVVKTVSVRSVGGEEEETARGRGDLPPLFLGKLAPCAFFILPRLVAAFSMGQPQPFQKLDFTSDF